MASWITAYKLVFSIIKKYHITSTIPVYLRRATPSQDSLNSIYFSLFSIHYPPVHFCPHAVGLHSNVENVCFSCCGGTSLIYTAILYKWNSFSSFYSLRTSVQKYHVAALVVTHSPSTPPISSNRSKCSFSPINPYGESIYN